MVRSIRILDLHFALTKITPSDRGYFQSAPRGGVGRYTTSTPFKFSYCFASRIYKRSLNPSHESSPCSARISNIICSVPVVDTFVISYKRYLATASNPPERSSRAGFDSYRICSGSMIVCFASSHTLENLFESPHMRCISTSFGAQNKTPLRVLILCAEIEAVRTLCSRKVKENHLNYESQVAL